MKTCCHCNRWIWSYRFYSERICVGIDVNKYFYHDECYLMVKAVKPVPQAPADQPNAPLTQI
jgi:hypothetical protein